MLSSVLTLSGDSAIFIFPTQSNSKGFSIPSLVFNLIIHHRSNLSESYFGSHCTPFFHIFYPNSLIFMPTSPYLNSVKSFLEPVRSFVLSFMCNHFITFEIEAKSTISISERFFTFLTVPYEENLIFLLQAQISLGKVHDFQLA